MTLAAGVVGYWAFDENAGSSVGDLSGNSEVGTWQGTVDGSQWTTGEIHSAGAFNGADQFVAIPAGALNAITAPMTLSAWFKTTFSGGAEVVFSTWDGTLGAQLNVLSGVVALWDDAALALSGTTGVADGAWHHIVAAWDGATAEVYLDGVSEASHASAGPSASTFDCQIGAEASGAGSTTTSQLFNGGIDEVGFWNRALNATEVGQLFTAGQYPFPLLLTRTAADTAHATNVARHTSGGRHRTAADTAHATDVGTVSHGYDRYSGAVVIAGLSGSTTFQFLDAGLESWEDPVFDTTGVNPSGTVWFKWTPAVYASATFTSTANVIDVYLIGAAPDPNPHLALIQHGVATAGFTTRATDNYAIRVFPINGDEDLTVIQTLIWATVSSSTINMTLPVTTLTTTPTNLVAQIGSEPAGETIFFNIVGNVTTIGTVVTDPSGNAEVSLPLAAMADGTYTLHAAGDIAGRTADATFTVAATVVVMPPDPLPPPPPVVVPVVHWTLQDPVTAEIYHLPINPTQAESTMLPKAITPKPVTAINGQTLLFEGAKRAKTWQFNGTVFTLADRAVLEAWVAKPYRVYITDDFGRTFIIKLLQTSMTPVRDWEHPENHSYVTTALLYGAVTP